MNKTVVIFILTTIGLLPFVLFVEAKSKSIQMRDSMGIGEDLEQSIERWDIPHCEIESQKVDCESIEYGEPKLETISTPSGDSSALILEIIGGASYPNVFYRRELKDYQDAVLANAFELDLYFFYQPESTFNNKDEPSRVQAIEFLFSVWRDEEVDNIFRVYDWEIQFANVRENQTLPPIWKLWNPGVQMWEPTGQEHVPAWVTGNEWHHLTIRGEILSEQENFEGGYATRFISYSIDDVVYPVDKLLSPDLTRPDQEEEVVTVNVQLDGSGVIDDIGGYQLLLDSVTLRYYDKSPWHSYCPTNAVEASNEFGGSKSHWELLSDTNNSGWKYNINALPPEQAPPIINGIVPKGTRADYWDGQQEFNILGAVRIPYAEIATIWCLDNLLSEKAYLPILFQNQ